MTLQEMEERMRSIQTDLRGIADLDNPSDDDVIVQDSLIQEFGELEGRVEPLRRRMADLDRIRKAATDPTNREGVAEVVSSRQAPTMHVRQNLDPLEGLDRVRMDMVSEGDLRARALNLIETDAKQTRYPFPHDYAEEATVRSQSKAKVAKHILLTGSEEYREAFRTYTEHPHEGERLFRSSNLENEMSYRAILLANASGGYLLPYILDPTIVLTNNASANPYRRVSRVVTTTSNAWQGVSSAGVNAAIIAEGATAADGAPSDFAQIQLKPVKAAAWILGSYEALDDEDFGTQLPGLLADAKDRLESSYFATGSGTNAPLGVAAAMTTATRVAPTTTGTAFNGTGSIPDIGNLMAQLPPRFRRSPSCAFMANIVQLNKIRSMDQYGGGGFWANLTSDTPPSLYGSPVYESSDLNSGTTGASSASGTGSATLFFADWQQFLIVDRVGVSMLYDPLIKGTGAAAQLPAGEAGWYMFWRFSSGISTTAGFRYLTIA